MVQNKEMENQEKEKENEKNEKEEKKDFREEYKWKGCGQRCGSTISCGTFQERKRLSFGKIFGYF